MGKIGTDSFGTHPGLRGKAAEGKTPTSLVIVRPEALKCTQQLGMVLLSRKSIFEKRESVRPPSHTPRWPRSFRASHAAAMQPCNPDHHHHRQKYPRLRTPASQNAPTPTRIAGAINGRSGITPTSTSTSTSTHTSLCWSVVGHPKNHTPSKRTKATKVTDAKCAPPKRC